MVQFLGAMVLWMALLTMLVGLIVWLLCNNRQGVLQPTTKSRDIQDVSTTIENAQSLVQVSEYHFLNLII